MENGLTNNGWGVYSVYHEVYIMKTIIKEIIPVLIMMLLLLSACSPAPDSYDFETAIENGDVVNAHGQTYNVEQLNSFLANVKSGHKAEVQITEYTIEGDPILQVLQYDGQVIRYTYDNSRDKFAGSDKGKKESEMVDILKEENEDTVIWYLVDAQGKKNPIFSMQKTESTEVLSDNTSELHKEIINDLMQHPELIPYEGVLGGTMGFYDPESILVLSDRWVFAGFDDGHINGYMLLSYRISDGKISWEVIDFYLDGE
ncbi:MAG TPA: DUF4362 domain-containing protein [Peptococcaceae bacterium]|nr:DUF4362 domain-containing protein [Peptococcaceae bacterium]